MSARSRGSSGIAIGTSCICILTPGNARVVAKVCRPFFLLSRHRAANCLPVLSPFALEHMGPTQGVLSPQVLMTSLA